MKKKLVAFAVTAAMVITSAVPVFAQTWGKPADPVQVGNVITIKEETPRTDMAGPVTAEGITFDTVIDLNKDAFNAYLNLNFKNADVTGWLNTGADGYKLTIQGGDTAVEDLNGIITLDWKVATTGIEVTVYENGYDEEPVGTIKASLPDGETEFTGLTVKPNEGNTVVLYEVAPEEVVAVEVVEAKSVDGKAQPVLDEDGEPIIVEQPVEGGSYMVNSITLDDGTVIKGDEVTKYAEFKWFATGTDGTKTLATQSTSFYIAPDTYDGCRITLEVSAMKAAGLFGGVVWGANSDPLAVADRLAGANRYETAYAVADALKVKNGGAKFNNIVVASGEGWCDALAGTTFAADLDAPIILVNGSDDQKAIDYIFANMRYDGTVYILGGENSVSADFEKAISKHYVVRLGGADRYETNLAILKEAVKKSSWGGIVAVSGKDFGDALSVAATGRPIMLVGDELTKNQKDFLTGLAKNKNIFVVGGTKVVSMDMQDTLAEYAKSEVKRFWGSNRYETAYAVATSELIKNKNNVVLVSGQAFADGLTGGVYAVENNAVVLLVDDTNTYFAGRYEKAKKGDITVIGGEAVVSNAVVQDVYSQKIA